MKNDETIKSLLKSGDIARLSSIKRLDWRIEKAASDVLIAYQLADGADSLQKLQTRLKSVKPGLLLVSRDPGVELGCPTWIAHEKAWPQLLHTLCNQYFPLPSKLKLLAVTGTNGKTTTADLVLQLGIAAGLKGFSIGTLGVRRESGTVEEFGLTTPGQIQLRQMLAHYGATADFVVMEASSHALEQERVYGLSFESAAWTNLTQDHLDYHGTMEAYFKSKERIFNYVSKTGFVFVPSTQQDLLTRLSKQSRLKQVEPLSTESRKELPVFFKARFNEENLLCAIKLIETLGVVVKSTYLKVLQPPPGRFYIREWKGKTAIVDFAHTPDALENILRAVKETFLNHNIIVLFGCGGDRDRTKRPLMGKIAAQFANELIVTSDNPRTEDPERIIQDIVDGVGQHPSLSREVDRPTAVRTALARLQTGDVLVMAGKGHEDYILKGTIKVPYSDIAELDGHIDLEKG